MEVVEGYISGTFNLLGTGLSHPHSKSEVVTYQHLRVRVMNSPASAIKEQQSFFLKGKTLFISY